MEPHGGRWLVPGFGVRWTCRERQHCQTGGMRHEAEADFLTPVLWFPSLAENQHQGRGLVKYCRSHGVGGGSHDDLLYQRHASLCWASSLQGRGLDPQEGLTILGQGVEQKMRLEGT